MRRPERRDERTGFAGVSSREYRGGCHCGAIRFRYSTEQAPDRWSIRACQCRFCRAHDALSASDPAGTLRFECDSAEMLQRYRFGLRTADFLLCRRCGVYIGAVIEAGRGRYGIINTHALDETPGNLAETGAISYEGEDTAGRISRREERWTPVTAVPW